MGRSVCRAPHPADALCVGRFAGSAPGNSVRSRVRIHRHRPHGRGRGNAAVAHRGPAEGRPTPRIRPRCGSAHACHAHPHRRSAAAMGLDVSAHSARRRIVRVPRARSVRGLRCPCARNRTITHGPCAIRRVHRVADSRTGVESHRGARVFRRRAEGLRVTQHDHASVGSGIRGSGHRSHSRRYAAAAR